MRSLIFANHAYTFITIIIIIIITYYIIHCICRCDFHGSKGTLENHMLECEFEGVKASQQYKLYMYIIIYIHVHIHAYIHVARKICSRLGYK